MNHAQAEETSRRTLAERWPHALRAVRRGVRPRLPNRRKPCSHLDACVRRGLDPAVTAAAAKRPVVLFACVHNSGRSVVAAALARHYAGDLVDVRDAGSDPADDRVITLGCNEECPAV